MQTTNSKIAKRNHRIWDDLMHGNMQSFFNQYFQDRALRRLINDSGIEYTPECDIEETESHYLFTMDLPGMNKNDIKIEVSGDQVIISGERKVESEKVNGSECISERKLGQFYRSFTLPTKLDPELVEANYNNGVLEVALAKVEGMGKTRVKINEGRSGLISRLSQKKRDRAA